MKLFSILGIASLLIILLAISDTDCNISNCTELQWGYSDGEFNQYSVSGHNKTKTGTLYDPTGQNISPDLIDRLTNEVETCLSAAFPDGTLTQSVVHNSICQSSHFPLPIDRTSFEVKIPDDWVLNCDGTQQLLPTPVKAGGAGCVAKGQTPDAQCPCRWRAGIRCPNTLIATPSLYIYKDVLIRLTTRCQNPWASPELAKCATPSTTPLSDGSDPLNGLF